MSASINADSFEKELLAAELKGSLLYFTQFFFKIVTGRDFVISDPVGRESHHITVCRALTSAFRLELPTQGLTIHMPPGYGKSTFVSMWVAWTMAHYPDSQYLYISYSHDLAAKHTAFIKQIMDSRLYRYLFDIELSRESKAKDFFKTSKGGSVRAFGSAGAVTGQDGGLPSLDRHSGAVILDDAIKPDDAHSDTMRARINRNYDETIRQRLRSTRVPLISIAQRVHEDDLGAFFDSGKDLIEWTKLVLPALDDAGNALNPELHTRDYLENMREKSPYVFASQYQQDPIPAGGSLFKPQWFLELDEEPELLTTFITGDTAETSKTYNDASAFSFWGIYEIETFGRKTGELGLHWLDCQELRVEPKDLKDSFLDFWQESARHPLPPTLAAIEKKSTGVTLLSVLDEIQGIQVRNVERTAASGSKTVRFLEMQPHIASKKVTFTKGAKHVYMCKEHMRKITANNSHRHDDICDTLYDAVKIALIDKTLYKLNKTDTSGHQVMSKLAEQMRRQTYLRTQRNGLR